MYVSILSELEALSEEVNRRIELKRSEPKEGEKGANTLRGAVEARMSL